jgi:hypothetical protein
MLVGIIFL